MLKPIFGALVILVSLSVNAKAATYNIAGSFDGGLLGLVEFDFDISGDFSAFIPSTAIASENINLLTREGADFTPLGGLGFSFSPSRGLSFGGLNAGIFALDRGTNDFLAGIRSDGNNPFPSNGLDSFILALSIDTSESAPDGVGTIVRLNLTFTEISAVPLPAGLPLLVTAFAALGGLGFFRWRKRAAAPKPQTATA